MTKYYDYLAGKLEKPANTGFKQNVRKKQFIGLSKHRNLPFPSKSALFGFGSTIGYDYRAVAGVFPFGTATEITGSL